MPSTSDLLNAINQAILDLTTSGVTAWTDNGKQVTMNNLPQLISARNQLQADLAAESGGNFRFASPLGRR